MRGRKNKPTALHKLHNTINKTKHRDRLIDEPIPSTPLAHGAPAWFTESQKESWNYAIENAPLGVLKAIDRGALTAWCVAEDMHRRAAQEQTKWDALYPGTPMLMRASQAKEAGLIQSLYIGIINRQATIMAKMMSELGFSPASRPRLASGTGPAAPELPPPSREDGEHPEHESSFEDYLDTDPDRPIH